MSRGRLRDQVSIIREAFERRRKAERDVIPQKVISRNTDGTQALRDQEGECILTGGIGDEYIGETTDGQSSPFSSLGSVGTGSISGTVAGLTLWIERLDPFEIPIGTVTTVKVYGRGFTSSTRLEFGLAGSRFPNENMVILSQKLVNETCIEIEVEVSGDAQPLASGSLFYDR